jgi:hypothetical protein
MSNTTKASSISDISCSKCHAVHGKMKTSGGTVVDAYAVMRFDKANRNWTASSKVFLRGIFYSSPYMEDGPPSQADFFDAETGDWSSFTSYLTSYGNDANDPFQGGVGPNHVVRVQGVGSKIDSDPNTTYPESPFGAHIDDNVWGTRAPTGQTESFIGYNPRTGGDPGLNDPEYPQLDTSITGRVLNSYYDYSSGNADQEQLCMRCHGNLSNLINLWSGHGAVNGANTQNNVYTSRMAWNQHYMYQNLEDGLSNTSNLGWVGDLSASSWGVGEYYNWSVDLWSHGGAQATMTVHDDQFAAGATDPGFTQKFHYFTCSKCHSPHASANARLMVTNCMNRDGTGANTFNIRESGPGRIVGTSAADRDHNIRGAEYPDPQYYATGQADRDIKDPAWRTNTQAQTPKGWEGQVRAVHCHNNMVTVEGTTGGPGPQGSYWQAIE